MMMVVLVTPSALLLLLLYYYYYYYYYYYLLLLLTFLQPVLCLHGGQILCQTSPYLLEGRASSRYAKCHQDNKQQQEALLLLLLLLLPSPPTFGPIFSLSSTSDPDLPTSSISGQSIIQCLSEGGGYDVIGEWKRRVRRRGSHLWWWRWWWWY